MTATTRTRVGPPTQGRYALDDTVTDGNGTVWTCTAGGMAGLEGLGSVGRAKFSAQTPGTGTSRAAVGTVSGTGAAVLEQFAGGLHYTTITLTALAQAVVNGTEYQSTKIYTFPEGRILVLGAQSHLAQTTTSALAGTLNASSTGAVGLGSVAASNVSLTSTMVDLGPSTAFTSSATVNVAGTAVDVVLSTIASFDGHATATPVYLNSAFATTTDVDADATMTWTGTVKLVWVPLGDY